MPASRINARRQPAMADFSTPVGLYLWTTMADAVSELNTFVKGSGVTHEKNVMLPENMVYADWAVPIQKSTTLVVKPRNRSVATSIKNELNSIPHEVLEKWTPKANKAYPSRLQVQRKIKACCLHVQAVIDYCIAVPGPIAQCELSDQLQAHLFTPDIALKICRGLGATRMTHLLYINRDDVYGNVQVGNKPGLQITTQERAHMLRFAEAYQHKQTLAHMRRMLGP
jgi:hypothetical protein